MSDAWMDFDLSLIESLLESITGILSVLGVVLKGLVVCYGLYEVARRLVLGFVSRALARRKGHRFSPLWGLLCPMAALIYAAGLPLSPELRRADLQQVLQAQRSPAPQPAHAAPQMTQQGYALNPAQPQTAQQPPASRGQRR